MNSNTLNIAIEVDDNGTPKIRKVGKELATAAKKGETGFKRTNKSLGDFNMTAAGTSQVIKGLIAGWAAMKFVQITKQTVDMADSWTLMENKLKLVTESERELSSVQQGLYELSLRSHASYSTSVDLYSRFAKATDSFGTSQQDLLRITETLNKATIISGSTQQEAAASLLQLSQGMASGVLRGEEFNSVTENSSRIAKILADHLEVDIGKLREMATQGEITSQVMLEAFGNAASDIDEEFAKMEVTVAQAMTDLKTLMGSVINDANAASDGTNEIAQGIQNIADKIDVNREGIISLFGAILSGASKAVEIVGNLGQSIAGFGAVGEGRLSFFEFATMDAKELGEWLKSNNDEVSRINSQLEESAAKIQSLRDRMAISPAARKQRREAIAVEREHQAALTDSRDMIIAMGAAVDDTYGDYGDIAAKALDDVVQEEEKHKAEIIKLKTDERYQAMQLSKGLYDDEKKLRDASLKEEQMSKAASLKNEQQLLAAAKKSAADQATAYRHMYDDMDDYSDDHYDLQVKLLDKEARKFRELGAAEDVVNRWRTRKHEELYDRYQLHVGSFVDGMAVAWRQMERDQLTWAEGGKAIFDTFIAESTSALSDNLFSVMKGDFDNLGGVWDSLWDTMLKTLTDVLAEMVVQYAASKITKFIGSIFFHDGAIEIKEDEFPAILQRGEMVVPARDAQQIRDGYASVGISGDAVFSAMGEGIGMDANLGAGATHSGGLDLGTFGESVAGHGGRALGSLASGVTSGRGLSPGQLANAATGFVSGVALDALGFNSPEANKGKTAGGIVGGLLGLGAAGAAALGMVGAIGFEAIADAMDTRENEGFLDAMEDAYGFFGSHARAGSLSEDGYSIEQIMAASPEALGIFDAHLTVSAMQAIDAVDYDPYGISEGGEDGGIGGVEGVGADMGNPGSDMGNIGDDGGGMMARDGGVFSGPDSGYRMTLHGTEAVIPLRDGQVPVEIQGADKEGAELLAEVKQLAAAIRHNNYQISQIVKNTGKSTRVLDKWDYDGQPAVRTQ